ncbi:uncharacterized protein DFL_001105 [Arthrobotrys flagrans]|uniref:Integrase catalytic domain-containing protein n=1 Tax=Arthrobotrys flagrans TaxID=97331 RepID=A0A437AG86_ARTFL|nr:hypothetical protein DFL_001105 [Arthrobotrys flagrans]
MEDILSRHGCIEEVVFDGGPENYGWVVDLLNAYNIKGKRISVYYAQSNGMIERGHKEITDSLSKLCNGRIGEWIRHLPAVLWADWTTARSTTGYTPYYLMYGMELLLPIDINTPTWHALPWKDVHSRAELIAMRARHLERRDEDLQEAFLRLRRHREMAAERWDSLPQVTDRLFTEGDMVLLHDTQLKFSHSAKLAMRWIGPYLIAKAYLEKGYYVLKELDGIVRAGTIASDRLKLFFVRPETNILIDKLPESELESPRDPAQIVPIRQGAARVESVVPSREEQVQTESVENSGGKHHDSEPYESMWYDEDDEDMALVMPSRLRPRPQAPLSRAVVQALSDNNNILTKRRPGRPKKHPYALLNEGPIQKRSRGRPRKNPLPGPESVG